MSFFSKKDYGIISYQDTKSTHIKLLYSSLLIFCFILVFICLAPVLWILVSSLKDVRELSAVPATFIPKTFHPEKIAQVWNSLHFGKNYVNSLIVVAGSVVCSVVFNGLAGYGISVLRPAGSKILFALILGSLMVPATTSLVPLFINIKSLNLNNSFLPLWLVCGANAFNVLLYKSFFDGIPRSLIEAARIDGCNDFKMFTKIIMPLSKAVNMVVVIFTLNAAWSDFLLPLLVLKDSSQHTVILKIYYMTVSNIAFAVDYRLIALGFSIIPPAILFIFFQKYITKGISMTGIKG